MKSNWIYAIFGIFIIGGIFLSFNLLSANAVTNSNAVAEQTESSQILLEVKIPCPGHASLISGELKKVSGVNSVEFIFPNRFNVDYDSSKISKEEILGINIFKEYPAEMV
jgi:copper chaperone CopZ